jgi:hypothetical protein
MPLALQVILLTPTWERARLPKHGGKAWFMLNRKLDLPVYNLQQPGDDWFGYGAQNLTGMTRLVRRIDVEQRRGLWSHHLKIIGAILAPYEDLPIRDHDGLVNFAASQALHR